MAVERASLSRPRDIGGGRPRTDSGKERPVAPPNPDDLIPSQRSRRDRIIQQAYDFLQDHDYEEIQMRDVADHAQVALGTVYRYFASKEHLFAAVLVRWGETLQVRMQKAPLRGDDVPSQLEDVYGRVIGAFEKLPQFFRLMMVIETTTDPYARELHQRFSETARTSLGAPLEALSEEEAEAVADVLTSVLGGVLRSWALGLTTAAGARARVSRTIRLIFSPPPKPVKR